MDFSSLMGGSAPPQAEQLPAFEYTAQVTSPIVSGEAKLTVGEEGLAVTPLFDAAEIPYADMTALLHEEYAVTVCTSGGDYAFLRMGSWAQPFYDALLRAYNKQVLKALFVQGDAAFTAGGDFIYTERGHAGGGSGPVQLYKNCICLLPPDVGARRIPLCFLSGMDKGGYELTLRVGGQQSYTLRKLGYDTESLAIAAEKQLHSLREQSLAAVSELDPALTAAQASAIARLMPQGAAAPIGQLAEIAPSFVEALESKIKGSRAAQPYQTFAALCDPARIYVGFKKNTARTAAPDVSESNSGEGGGAAPGGLAGMLGGLTGEGGPLGALGGMLGGENAAIGAAAADPYTLWLVAPSPRGDACAVEFAGAQGDSAATFVYRFSGDFDSFAQQLNIALEAIDFKREVIRLSDDELKQPQYVRYRMAVQRNGALQFVRSCFAGRVIHTGTWEHKLRELWSSEGEPPAAEQQPTEALNEVNTMCAACGAQIPADVKFCGMCGTPASGGALHP